MQINSLVRPREDLLNSLLIFTSTWALTRAISHVNPIKSGLVASAYVIINEVGQRAIQQVIEDSNWQSRASTAWKFAAAGITIFSASMIGSPVSVVDLLRSLILGHLANLLFEQRIIHNNWTIFPDYNSCSIMLDRIKEMSLNL